MNFFLLFYFVIFAFDINIAIQSSYIVLPFKYSTKEKKSYPENLLQNDLEITLNIGTPPQSVDLNLRSKAYAFFVTSVEANMTFKTFNDSNSKSLIKETKKPEPFGGQEYAKGYMIYESIYINGNEIKDVSLILATEVNSKEAGALGLRLVEEHDSGDYLSFILQLKKKLNFDSYSYTIKYKNDNEGELIIGSYPHMYDDNYSEKNFYQTKAGTVGKNVDWILNFDMIKYNNKSIFINKRQGFTQIEFGLIQAPFEFKKHFNDNFFKHRCYERFNLKRNITILHCNQNFPIKDFKDLTFILKDINLEFTLTYEDLFIKENNEYIFGIVFDENKDNKYATWILGKPFMKKYPLIYDLDKKIIGTYIGNKEEEKKNPINLTLLILLIALGIIVIGLVIFIIFYLKKPRKNRAAELNDDNYEYFPNE